MIVGIRLTNQTLSRHPCPMQGWSKKQIAEAARRHPLAADNAMEESQLLRCGYPRDSPCSYFSSSTPRTQLTSSRKEISKGTSQAPITFLWSKIMPEVVFNFHTGRARQRHCMPGLMSLGS